MTGFPLLRRERRGKKKVLSFLVCLNKHTPPCPASFCFSSFFIFLATTASLLALLLPLLEESHWHNEGDAKTTNIIYCIEWLVCRGLAFALVAELVWRGQVIYGWRSFGYEE
jgi:hypothetical protein